MILREYPDLPPRPATSANGDFRRWFIERWGRENAVIFGRTRVAEYPDHTQTLSIKTAWNGSEHYYLGNRRVCVDDDSYLVLNEGDHYGSQVCSHQPIESLCIFFRPRMAIEVAAAMVQTASAALDAGSSSAGAPASMNFAENLRPHDHRVSPKLAAIAHGIRAGEADEDWLEEQLLQLLALMLGAEPGFRARSMRVADLSPSAHAELLSRVDRATDLILSSYADPITLGDMAAAARLSKFHLVRVFRAVHGVTPHAFLSRKRAEVARRLLLRGDASVADVAAEAGFGSRHSMFRHLRSQFGAGAQALRESAGISRGHDLTVNKP
jgi:AraC-like DNA-binding protein